MDHIVCVGVLAFKTRRLQKRKGVWGIVRTCSRLMMDLLDSMGPEHDVNSRE